MSKKKVLINGRFSSHHFAIRNVILNVARQLSGQLEYDTYIVLNKDSDIDDFKSLNLKIIYNPLKADSAALNHLYTLFVLPWILLFKGISIVVYPQICIYCWNPLCKVILYMHDLIEYHFDSQNKKKLIFRKFAYPYVCRHADKIITVSECTKKDVIKYFGIKPEKIIVAYDGKDEDLVPIPNNEACNYVKNKYNIDNFVFYIGYLTHPQKNLFYLIDEFSSFRKIHPEVKLVFAGPKGKNADDILQHAKSLIPSENFFYLGKVPYRDLKYLYSACQIFCFPSLFEGFGMPVLEAMSCGAVVLASNRSSIPEILDNEDLLINPECKGQLAQKLNDYYCCTTELIKKNNIERSKLFTWAEHGKILRKVIKELL